MQAAAGDLEFEEAARLRDEIRRLQASEIGLAAGERGGGRSARSVGGRPGARHRPEDFEVTCSVSVVIGDDVEGPNPCATPKRRAELRQRLRELEYVLTPGGIRNALEHRRLLGLMRRYHAQSADRGRAAVIAVTPERAELIADTAPS